MNEQLFYMTLRVPAEGGFLDAGPDAPSASSVVVWGRGERGMRDIIAGIRAMCTTMEQFLDQYQERADAVHL